MGLGIATPVIQPCLEMLQFLAQFTMDKLRFQTLISQSIPQLFVEIFHRLGTKGLQG